MMETNKYAFRSTSHKCDGSIGSFNNCDRDGICHTDVLTDKPSGVYAPGSSTNQLFQVKQEFLEDSGSFTGYVTTLSQHGREVVLSETNCGSYMDNMSTQMTQMVIAISNWGSSSLDWLQHGVCEGQCSTTSTFSQLKNLSFTTTEISPVIPDRVDVTYAFGNDCANLTDEDCSMAVNC